MANLNIRIDDTLKKQAETVFSDLGISLSAATTIFLKQVVRCNGIPFELRADPIYPAEPRTRSFTVKKRIGKVGETVHELIERNESANCEKDGGSGMPFH